MAPIMAAAGDEGDAKRLLELLSKLDDGQLTVAFCGHFSAGKSTLVNRLCGTELLPSSPIPTSANVVSIRNGERERKTASQVMTARKRAEVSDTRSINWKRIAETVKRSIRSSVLSVAFAGGGLGAARYAGHRLDG